MAPFHGQPSAAASEDAYIVKAIFFESAEHQVDGFPTLPDSCLASGCTPEPTSSAPRRDGNEASRIIGFSDSCANSPCLRDADDATLFSTIGSAGWLRTCDSVGSDGTPEEDRSESDIVETEYELDDESGDDETDPEIVVKSNLSNAGLPGANASFEGAELANVNFAIRFGFSPPGWQRPGAKEEADENPYGGDAFSCSSSSVSSGDDSVLGLPDEEEKEEHEEDGDEEIEEKEEERGKARDDKKTKEKGDIAKEEEKGEESSRAGPHSNVNFAIRFGFSPPGWQRPGAQEEADGYESAEDPFSCSSSCISSEDDSLAGMSEVEEETEEDDQKRAKASDYEKATKVDRMAKEWEEEESSEGLARPNVNFTIQFGFSPVGWQRPGAQEEADKNQSGGEECSWSSSSVSSEDDSVLEMPEADGTEDDD